MSEETEPIEGILEDPGPPPVFPQAGRDLTPTPAMIERGAHGNGAWDFTDGSVAVAYHERHQAKKEAEDERLDHFNNEAKEALSQAVRLHQRVIAAAETIMDEIEAGNKVNGAQLNILAKGLASARELTDRAAGKARTSTETISETSGLAFLIAGGDQ